MAAAKNTTVTVKKSAPKKTKAKQMERFGSTKVLIKNGVLTI